MGALSPCAPQTDVRYVGWSDCAALAALVLLSAAFFAITINRSEYAFILRADEGYSFSAAVRVADGMIPQKDFSYAYGPLMPYVYATAFKIWGTSLAVMRGVWAIAYIASLVLFFVLGRAVLPRWIAFALGLTLIGQVHTPLYSYNHIGLVLLVQLELLSGIGLIYERKWVKWSAAIAFLFTIELFVKFNEAIAVFFFLSVGLLLWRLFDQKHAGDNHQSWPFLLKTWTVVVTVPLAIFAITTIWLNLNLTKEQFYRNFPILPEYHATVGGYQYVWNILSLPFHLPISSSSAWTWYALWYENYYYAIVITLLCGVTTVAVLITFLMVPQIRMKLHTHHWAGVLFGSVALALYHEFYMTGNHWAAPMYLGFSSLFLFWAINQLTQNRQPIAFACIGSFIVVCGASSILYAVIANRYFSEYALDLDRARIYSSADSDSDVIAQAVRYIDANTPRNSEFAAFPHDSLLIHLAARKNALRDDDYQWMLFPTPASDREVETELESKHVWNILISNFTGFKGGKAVSFGIDYLVQTSNYIQTHYHPVKIFPPGPTGYSVTYYERNVSTVSANKRRVEDRQ